MEHGPLRSSGGHTLRAVAAAAARGTHRSPIGKRVAAHRAMKLCPYCSGEMAVTATICQHCGRDWKSGVSHFAPVQHIPHTTFSASSLGSEHAANARVSGGTSDKTVTLPNHRNIGRVYAAVTLVLLVVIAGSWQCVVSQNVGHHPTETLRNCDRRLRPTSRHATTDETIGTATTYRGGLTRIGAPKKWSH